MVDILEFESVKKFIAAVGKDVEKYFGKDDACIVYLKPDGVFYGEGLYQWLKKKKKNIALTTMDDDGVDLDAQSVRGCKILLVDNDIITGKGFKRSMEALRMRKAELELKGIKFAVFADRIGLADFSASKYSVEGVWHLGELDAKDLKIISLLSQDGRMSLAEIGQKIGLSSVAVKNRADKLLKEKIIRINGALSIDQFYTMSAQIGIDADEKTVLQMIEDLEKIQEVYLLVRTVSGRYHLMVGVLSHNLENIEQFIENKIRSVPGVKRIDVYVGELPVRPKTIPP